MGGQLWGRGGATTWAQMLMVKTHRFTAFFTPDEYQAIRRASSTGRLGALKEYSRDEKSGQVTFVTIAPKKFFSQIEKIIDFGTITAPEALQGAR